MVAASPTLRIRLFGRLEIWRDGQAVPDAEWRGQKPRDLLKILLLAQGRFVPNEQLCAWLWPEADRASAEANLRSAVRDLRRLLEPGLASGRDSAFVHTRREGYAFNLAGSVWLDVSEFERDLTQQPGALSRAAVERALALYRGDLLEEDPFAEWAQSERDRLRELRFEGLGRLVELCLAAQDYEAAAQYAEQALRLDVGRESLWRSLMTALARSGDRAAALRAFDRCRAALARDLGVDPLPETSALHERILRGEVGPASGGRAASALTQEKRTAGDSRWLYRLAAVAVWGWVTVTLVGLTLSLLGLRQPVLVSPGGSGGEVLPYLLAHPEAMSEVRRQLYFLVPASLLLLPVYLAWHTAIRAAGTAPAAPFNWTGLTVGVLDVAAHTLSRALTLAQLTVLPAAYVGAQAAQRANIIVIWDVLRQLASTFGVVSATGGPLAAALFCWAAVTQARQRSALFPPLLMWAGILLSALTLAYSFLLPGGAVVSPWFWAGVGLAIANFAWLLSLSVAFLRLRP